VYDPLALENMELPGRFSYGVLPDAAATPYLGPSCYREFTISGASDLERDKDLNEISLGIVMAGTGGAINSNIANLLAWAKSGTGGETIELCHQFTTPLSIFSYGIAQMKYDSPVSGLLLNWYGHATAANSCGGSFKNLVEVFTEELQARNGTGTIAPTLEPTEVL
jgi:hypothetical protein